jgi:putative endonuclease
MRQYCVYILASRSRRLYTGVTNNLLRRVLEHRAKRRGTFTGRYDIVRLVYYECGSRAGAAIAREKQIKGWSRRKKLALIGRQNPEFRDLAEEWLAGGDRDSSPLRGSNGATSRDSSPLRGSE